MATDTTDLTSDQIARAHAVAARTKCDLRTAIKAIRLGPETIRTRCVREAVAAALRETEGGRAA